MCADKRQGPPLRQIYRATVPTCLVNPTFFNAVAADYCVCHNTLGRSRAGRAAATPTTKSTTATIRSGTTTSAKHRESAQGDHFRHCPGA
jgi:hypothetical protein